jgi:O-antigen/teichoic acid export membrane protein
VFQDLLINKIINNKELFWNIIGSIGIKGLAMIVSVLSLPAYLSYFSDYEILGVWFTIISILNWVLTFDLGIGNGLRNLLVEPILNRDFIKIKEYISTAYVTIGLISISLGVLSFFLIRFLNWNTVLNIDNNILSNESLLLSIQLIFIAVILQLFLKLVLSVLYALQKTAISNFILLFSNLCILFFLMFYEGDNVSESLYALSIFYIVAINLPLILVTIIVFSVYLKQSKPNFKFYRKKYSGQVVQLGFFFLGIQLSLLVINSSNEFIISKFFLPENVVEYQAYFRVFSLNLVLFSLFTVPLWSAITKAFTEGNISWIKKVYKYLNIVAFVFSIFIVVKIFFFHEIIHLWLGQNAFIVNDSTSIIFGLYYCLMIFVYSANCIANGISKLKPQLILTLFAALCKFPIVFFFYKYYNHWDIVIITNVVIMIPCLLIQPFQNYKELNIKFKESNVSSL